MPSSNASGSKPPLISVLVPFYNAHAYLQSTLQQLAALTYPQLEIVFADDGSSDGGRQLVSSWVAGRPNARLLVSEQNQGVGTARNALLRAAAGEFVWFADVDDQWKPDILTQLVDLVVASDADIAICGFQISPLNGGIRRSKQFNVPQLPGSAIAPLLYRERVEGQLWNKLIRRSLFDVDPFPPYRLREDIVALVPVLRRARSIAFTDEILYTYVRHGSSLVSEQSYSRETLLASIRVMSHTFPQDWWHGFPANFGAARFFIRAFVLQIAKAVIQRVGIRPALTAPTAEPRSR